MIVGNIVAVRQRNVKRLLAYSSIAHVGYMMAALLTPGARAAGGGALLFYIVAYSVVTFGAFAVTMAVTGDRVEHPSADDISSFAGLSQTNPRIAAAMTLFLLTLAGLPPGIVGLVGKFYLLSVVVQSHFVGLAVVAALCSAISCYFYLRVITAMYVHQVTDVTPAHFVSPLGTRIVIGSMVAASIILGVLPSFLYNRAQAVAHGVFVR
jgi:NADH-quinone oxidoreductase subunit N